MTEPYDAAPGTGRPRVLVTGATGTTGRLVRTALHHHGVTDVIAASRRPDGPTAIAFDWADVGTHAAALAGIETAYLVPPPGRMSPASVMVPFLRRAVDAGLRRAVLLGAVSVDAGPTGVGEVYDAVSGLVPEWAVLRPSWFMQNVLGDHQQARSLRTSGVVRTATGEGRVPFVDAADIAEVAACTLLAPTAPDRELVLTGPAALSYDEVAAVLTEVTGRRVRHQHLTVEQLRDEVFADLPRDFAETLAEMDSAIARGAWNTVTSEVERVTGRPARSFEDFARAHRTELTQS